MNIFEEYLEKIKLILEDLASNKELILPNSLAGINTELPPEKFNSDISTNVAMVLSKINNKSSIDLANNLAKLIQEKDNFIDTATVVKPGFINNKLKKVFWTNFTEKIIKNSKVFGINNKEKKHNYLIEFVSANPTGPLHVGHCRGAILGDVLANLLLFNENMVTKEYYINDYGNQITNFTRSVYLRIREIIYKEPFPLKDEDLYPGDYLKDFAHNIINSNKEIDFEEFEKVNKFLTEVSLNEALNLIKENLNSLGIKHDNFVSEKKLVENKEVEKTVSFLKNNKFVYKGKIKAPSGEKNNDWVEREQLLFKSTDFATIKTEHYKNQIIHGLILRMIWLIIKNKLDRNFDYLINILGADHAGYISRITASVDAISNSKNKLICKVSQLVKLIKDNKPFKMSKRKEIT